MVHHAGENARGGRRGRQDVRQFDHLDHAGGWEAVGLAAQADDDEGLAAGLTGVGHRGGLRRGLGKHIGDRAVIEQAIGRQQGHESVGCPGDGQDLRLPPAPVENGGHGPKFILGDPHDRPDLVDQEADAGAAEGGDHHARALGHGRLAEAQQGGRRDHRQHPAAMGRDAQGHGVPRGQLQKIGRRPEHLAHIGQRQPVSLAGDDEAEQGQLVAGDRRPRPRLVGGCKRHMRPRLERPDFGESLPQQGVQVGEFGVGLLAERGVHRIDREADGLVTPQHHQPPGRAGLSGFAQHAGHGDDRRHPATQARQAQQGRRRQGNRREPSEPDDLADLRRVDGQGMPACADHQPARRYGGVGEHQACAWSSSASAPISSMTPARSSAALDCSRAAVADWLAARPAWSAAVAI